MRVLICGSRSWDQREPIARLIEDLARYADEHMEMVTVVVGDARGADAIAAELARRAGLRVEMHWADWAGQGKRAGVLRNLDMLNSGVREVYAFRCQGKSTGTDHTIEEAHRRGLQVTVVEA